MDEAILCCAKWEGETESGSMFHRGCFLGEKGQPIGALCQGYLVIKSDRDPPFSFRNILNQMCYLVSGLHHKENDTKEV